MTKRKQGHEEGFLLACGALLLVVWVSGCAINLPSIGTGEDYLRSHILLAHEDGFPLSLESVPSREELKPPKNQEDIETRILAGIDVHASRLWPNLAKEEKAKKPTMRLLLFVHGGLNGYRDDFERMRQMIAGPEDCLTGGKPGRLFVSEVCGKARTSYYPIFLNWNSGLPDSVLDDILFIRFGRRLPVPDPIIGSLVLAGRLVEAVFSAPNGWWANIRNFRDSKPKFDDWIEAVAMSPIRGLTTPVVKAFGTPAWRIMKRRAHLLVAERLEEAPVEKSMDNPAATNHMREGAARTLLRLLNGRIARSPNGAVFWKIGSSKEGGPRGPVEITVVGYSMGAIVINRLVATLDNFPFHRIIYLAPASSIDEIQELIGPHRKKKDRTDFRTFTLNRRDEARERDRTRLAPRGTLLVWIDSFFEPVAQLGDNRFGRYKSHIEFYGNDGPPCDLKVCELAEAIPNRPKKHGDIDNAPYLESILWRLDPEAFNGQSPSLEMECTTKQESKDGQ